jgi:PPOX class probable F420-dependent enzyme
MTCDHSNLKDDRLMQLVSEQCLSLAANERVGYLATASAAGLPHLVPVTFALTNRQVLVGIDAKPKSSTDLKRVRNIRENPRAAILWDRYDENWAKLWWVRADGSADVLEDGAAWAAAWGALNSKYAQYEGSAHDGPIIAVTIDRWTGWSYSDEAPL